VGGCGRGPRGGGQASRNLFDSCGEKAARNTCKIQFTSFCHGSSRHAVKGPLRRTKGTSHVHCHALHATPPAAVTRNPHSGPGKAVALTGGRRSGVILQSKVTDTGSILSGPWCS